MNVNKRGFHVSRLFPRLTTPTETKRTTNKTTKAPTSKNGATNTNNTRPGICIAISSLESSFYRELYHLVTAPH